MAERVLEALRHRGPDGSDSKTWPEATILHTRLCIIDLSHAGDQPMLQRGRHRSRTVYNGRDLTVHRELQAELEKKGHRFRGRSTRKRSRHLCRGVRPSRCLARLRGMFAAAIPDLRERRLLLARDRRDQAALLPRQTGAPPFPAVSSMRFVSFRCRPDASDPQAIADFAGLPFVPRHPIRFTAAPAR